jgi:anti-sigma28 factor (negative regulator of flagellin synthesis)
MKPARSRSAGPVSRRFGPKRVNQASRIIWKKGVHTATASVRSTNNQEEMSVLNIHLAIPTSEPGYAQSDKVAHVRLMLANETYHVSLAQVAAKVIDDL